jgi:3-keto-L-gulonate-6-phosphate decarboxylase
MTMKTVVQISLDLTSISEAVEAARLALRAGVDWLEAGTPLIVSEGMDSVRALRAEFPGVPIVADLKIMDGGWPEARTAAKAGATHVVVMERAHTETIKMVVRAGKDFGLKVVGDNLWAPRWPSMPLPSKPIQTPWRISSAWSAIRCTHTAGRCGESSCSRNNNAVVFARTA